MKATNVAAVIVTVVLATGCNPGSGGGGSRRAQVSTGAAVGTTVLAGALVEARVLHQATALDDGASVLITGGETLTSPATTTAELWQGGQSVPLAEAMATGRRGHTAVRLPTGEVWIAGGVDASGAALASTEVWSPATRTFRPGPDLREARGGAAICAVASGIVLAGGGAGVEVWGTDLSAGPTFPLAGARVLDRLVEVQPGLLYLAGGVDLAAGAPSTPVLIDLAAGAVTPAPGAIQVALGAPVAATLDGTTRDVFVVGGTFDDRPFTHLQRVRAGDAELVQVLPDLLVSRERAAVVALGRGILVAGGLKNGQPVDAVEVVQAEGSSLAAPLRLARYDLVATTLAGGAVLFTGGRGQDDLPVALTELLVPPGAAAPDGGALFARARQERADRAALVAERDAAQAEVARLEAALRSSEDALSAERAETARLEQELAAARARIADLEAKVAGLEGRLAQTQAQLSATQGALAQVQGDLQAARGDLDRAKQRELFLQLEVNGGKDQAQRLEQEKQALAAQVGAQQARADQAAQQAAALQGQVTSLQGQVTSLQAQPASGAGRVTTRRAVSYAPQQLGLQINGLRQR